MAYDKRPGKGGGKFQGDGGFRPGQRDGGNRGGGSKGSNGGGKQERDKGAYGKPSFDKPAYGKPAHGKPSFDKPAYGKPAHGKPSFDKSGHGKPPLGKPQQGKGGYAKPAEGGYGRPQRAEQFFGKPMGPGPRRAAPTGRSVPPAARVDDRPQVDYVPEQDIAIREEDVARDNILAGRNPIREAIKAGRTIDKLLVQEGELSGSARQIVSWARDAHIVVQHVEKARLDQIYPNHQGMVAFVAAAEYSTVDDILAYAKQRDEDAFVVVLDSITDPHNLGAIIRSAECAGAHGVIITERRSALLTPSAVKASAGACEYQRIAKVVNLSRTLDQLKEQGLWVIGADMAGEPALQADLSGPIALVIGSEGDGMSRLVSKQCDKLVALPLRGKIESLNASVAAGILMYEVLRARS